MGHVWDLDIDHNERMVLLAMTDHADHEGRNMRASMALLAWKTSYSTRNVQRIVRSLEEKGIIRVQEFRLGGSTVYWLDLEAGTRKAPYRYDALSRAQRKSFIRDRISQIGAICQYCSLLGTAEFGPDSKSWSVRLVVPKRSGGRYEIDNLALCCAACDESKDDDALPMTSCHPRHFVTPVVLSGDDRLAGDDARGQTSDKAGGNTDKALSPEPYREPSEEPNTSGANPPSALFSPETLVPGRVEIRLSNKAERAFIKEEFAHDLEWLKWWKDWCSYMSKKNRALKSEQAQPYFDMFENYPVAAVTESIKVSVQKGYKDIYEDRIKRNAAALAPQEESLTSEEEILKFAGVGK